MFLLGKYRNGVGLGRAIVNLTAPLRVWSERQVRRLKGAFSVGGHQNHGGEPWQPAADPADFKVMVGSGRLRGSIKYVTKAKSARIFTDVSYAKYHQEGRGMPKRLIITVTGQDKKDLEQELKRQIDQMINGS